jgi:predicted kinase
MSLTLTLIRGLPGSGKSTLAKRMSAHHLEADMYFVDDEGQYRFSREKLNDAHEWCQRETQIWLAKACDVVVSNTFVQAWEMEPYRRLAEQYNAKLTIIVCRGEFQNVHNVDSATIEAKRKLWEEVLK